MIGHRAFPLRGAQSGQQPEERENERMTDEYKYEVRGYRKQSDVHGFGSQCEIGCDTLKEAKAKARFILTDESMRQSESSSPLGYSQVIQRFTGECVADFFNPRICPECGQTIDPRVPARTCDTCAQPTGD